eukprot:6091276-Pyramimonas_sp.AAC.1
MALDTDWSEAFLGHDHYDMPGDTRPVFPVALYFDGIKYTRSIGPGRADSVFAVTCYNLCTKSRHVIAVLSKKEQCKCGCRGWDSHWQIFNYIRWSMKARRTPTSGTPALGIGSGRIKGEGDM